jgi:hypothetical protein
MVLVNQGDTLNFKIGNNGISGCSYCSPSCGALRGSNGLNGTPSIFSINSYNHNNFILKANAGTGGEGSGVVFIGSCGCYGNSPVVGNNGILEYGVNFNSYGILNLTQDSGLGSFVSIRW